jgi:hypothetical protein
MDGQELNGIYDGYTYWPFYLSHSNATCFQHTWDYEAAPRNHWVPNYGLFSGQYFKSQLSQNLKSGHAYTSIKKDNGPPHKHYNALYDPLDKNEYLAERGVDVEALRNVHNKVIA